VAGYHVRFQMQTDTAPGCNRHHVLFLTGGMKRLRQAGSGRSGKGKTGVLERPQVEVVPTRHFMP